MLLRKAFEGDLIPKSSENPYLGNAFGWANVLVTAGDIASKPLSCSLAKCDVPSTSKEHAPSTRHTKKWSERPEWAYQSSSSETAGWYRLGSEIGPRLACLIWILHLRVGHEASGPCRPSYVQENHGPIKPADAFFILGKDEKGNYWTSTCKVKGQWAKFEEELRKWDEEGR
jgi:hypothetical protein